MKIAIMTPVTMGAAEKSAERRSAERKSDDDGNEDAIRPGTIISLRAAAVEMSTQRSYFRTSGAFHYAGDLSELAADFFYHFLSRAAYRLDGEGAEEEGQKSSDEEADHDLRVFEVYRGEVRSLRRRRRRGREP